MPSFFIIAFIWRGLMFPGSILLTPLPYSYRSTVIKCKHLCARKERCAAGKEPISLCNHHHIVPRADLRVCCDYVLCKRILALRHKLCHVLADHDPVAGRGDCGEKPSRPFDPEREPAVRCTDGCKADAVIEDLPNPPGGRQQELEALGKERGAAPAPELVVSDCLHPGR